jgi:hypothetical protein
MRKLFIVLTLFIAVTSHSQENLDTAINSYFTRLPAILPVVDSVYKYYAPAITNTPCQRYRTELKKQVGLLADQSDHKSYLLSTLSGRYDNEGRRYDFTKVKNATDKALQAAVDKATAAFFRAIDDYNRSIGPRLDSIYKNFKGVDMAKPQLDIYRKEMAMLINTVKKILLEWNKTMNAKGYNKQLLTKNASYPYYIQVLEARGLFYDRVLRLLEMEDGAMKSIASMIDVCRKYPESCK